MDHIGDGNKTGDESIGTRAGVEVNITLALGNQRRHRRGKDAGVVTLTVSYIPPRYDSVVQSHV